MKRIAIISVLLFLIFRSYTHCETIKVPLTFYVTTIDDITLCDSTYIYDRVRVCNTLFDTVEVEFTIDTIRPLPIIDIPTADSRDSLVTFHNDPGVTVFVIGDLHNIDDSGLISGVHWRYRGDLSKSYIILSVHSSPPVLSHEMGHLFSLPHDNGMNIMHPTATLEDRLRFSSDQITLITKYLAGKI